MGAGDRGAQAETYGDVLVLFGARQQAGISPRGDLGAGVGGAWIAALSDGDQASRSSLLYQDLMMIGVVVIAIVIARNIPAWPGGKARRESSEPANEVTVAVPAD